MKLQDYLYENMYQSPYETTELSNEDLGIEEHFTEIEEPSTPSTPMSLHDWYLSHSDYNNEPLVTTTRIGAYSYLVSIDDKEYIIDTLRREAKDLYLECKVSYDEVVEQLPVDLIYTDSDHDICMNRFY